MVRVNQGEEAGQYLRIHKEIEEEPSLTGNWWREILSQMIPVALVVSKGKIHLTVLPILARLSL